MSHDIFKWKHIAMGAGLLVLLLQLVPYGRDHSNPPVTGEPAWDSPRTRELFYQACGDCHSNTTRWPWYSHVAPASWLVQHDVKGGRSHLNVSEWGRTHNHGDEAADMVRDGDMPPWYYLPAHPAANLPDEQKQVFLQGLAATFEQDGAESHEHADDSYEHEEGDHEHESSGHEHEKGGEHHH